MPFDHQEIMTCKSSGEEESDESMDEDAEAAHKSRQAKAACTKHLMSVEMKHIKMKNHFTCERMCMSKDLNEDGEHTFKTDTVCVGTCERCHEMCVV